MEEHLVVSALISAVFQIQNLAPSARHRGHVTHAHKLEILFLTTNLKSSVALAHSNACFGEPVADSPLPNIFWEAVPSPT